MFSRVWTRDLSLRIGADPFFSFLCIFLFLSEISNCSKWPFIAFETDPYTSTATGVALLFVFHNFFIFLARSWYLSCFSISFCMNNITASRICNSTLIVSLVLVFVNCNVRYPLMTFSMTLNCKIEQHSKFLNREFIRWQVTSNATERFFDHAQMSSCRKLMTPRIYRVLDSSWTGWSD